MAIGKDRIMGISPMPTAGTPAAPQVASKAAIPPNPAVSQPAGNTGFVPQRQGGSPVPATPGFNPSARDMALRNLATQTPAAPTAPAPAPAPAATPPSGQMTATAAGATNAAPQAQMNANTASVVRAASDPTFGAQFFEQNPDLQPLLQAIHDAGDPAARSEAISTLVDQIRSMMMTPQHNANVTEHQEQTDYDRAHDEFEREDKLKEKRERREEVVADARDTEARQMRRRRLNRTAGGIL